MVSECGTVLKYSHSGNTIPTTPDKDGYLKISYWDNINKKQRKMFVHRLVAETYLMNNHNLPFVNHKDGVKTNNALTNLEWCTASHNVKHAYELGLINVKKGEDSHHTSLTNERVHEICFDISQGLRNVDIRKKYNISKSTLDHIRYGDAWKDIKGHYNMTSSRKGRLGKGTVFWILSKLDEGLQAKEILGLCTNPTVNESTIYNLASKRIYKDFIEDYENTKFND